MDKLAFMTACEEARKNMFQKNGIGTLQEKTTHAVVKQYLEPDREYQEQRFEGYVADILKDDQIIEIQTRGFNKLRDKLKAFLPHCEVTIAYPIPYEKWVIWLKEDTLQQVSRRRSPKKGKPYEIFKELYKIKAYLNHPNLHLHILLVNMEEYRLLNGWSYDKKRGSTRYDRIPLEIMDEIQIEKREDYIKLLPEELGEVFTTKDYQKCGKVPIGTARLALNILYSLDIVEKVGKEGNTILYSRK